MLKRIAAIFVMVIAGSVLVAPHAQAAVSHRIPFPCGQTWSGQTRPDHSPNRAIDFNRSGDYGDAIVASAAGRVIHRGLKSGTHYGRLVVIRHSDGTVSYYAHMSSYAVSLNQSVSQGQKVGTVGGDARPLGSENGYGAHLHYEQRTSFNGTDVSIRFAERSVYYYGTRSYTSQNRCGGGGSERDGVCNSGEFCYYYNSNHEGSLSDHAGSLANYGDSQPTCYEFKSAGAGQGQCIKNNAASAWNRSSRSVRVYYNSNYGGTYQTFAPGEKKNLSAALKNENASHRFL